MKVAAFVLVLLLTPGVGHVAAEVLWKEDATLPYPWYNAASVWTGSYGYLFGNADIYSRSAILRVDPATMQVTTMGATLPTYQRAYQAAAWTGTHAYIFGGIEGPEAKDRAMRYDPATDTLVVLPARIPGGRDRASAVYDPRVLPGCPAGCIYIAGGMRWDSGRHAYDFYDRIVRYDVAGDAYTTLDARLPKYLYSMAAAFDGETMWLFGGQDQRGTTHRTIYAFDPVTGTVRQSAASLPNPRYGVAAAWNGSVVFLAGGREYPPYYDDVWVFDPATETTRELAPRLTTARWGMAPFPYGDGIVLAGGMQYDPTNNPIPEILHYDPHLAPPPATLTASPGPGRGEVTLTFDASSDPSVTGYEIHLRNGDLVASLTTPGTFVDVGPEGAPREYRVRAVNAWGAGPYGPVAAAMPPGLPGAPTSPGTLRGPGPGDVRVTWRPPTLDGGSPILRYRVYGGDAPGAETFLGESTTLSFTDRGVPTGATRWYRVSAVNSPGEGALSAEVSGQPPTRPGAPGPLRASTGLQRIDLTWAPPASDGGTAVTGYVVYRGQPGAETPYATLGPVLSWSDTGRAGLVTYSYRVLAVNGVGEGPLGNAAASFALGPATYKVMTGGVVVVFDDRDDDNVVDPGETLVSVPLLP